MTPVTGSDRRPSAFSRRRRRTLNRQARERAGASGTRDAHISPFQYAAGGLGLAGRRSSRRSTWGGWTPGMRQRAETTDGHRLPPAAQDSGKPWHRRTRGPSPCSATFRRMPLAWTSHWVWLAARSYPAFGKAAATASAASIMPGKDWSPEQTSAGTVTPAQRLRQLGSTVISWVAAWS
jgi:hypothetical protein